MPKIAQWVDDTYFSGKCNSSKFVMELLLNGLRQCRGGASTLANIILTGCSAKSIDEFFFLCAVMPHATADVTADFVVKFAKDIIRAANEHVMSGQHRLALWRCAFSVLQHQKFRHVPELFLAIRACVTNELKSLLGFTFTQLVRSGVQDMAMLAERLFVNCPAGDLDAVGMNPERMTDFFQWMEGLEFHKESAASASMACTSWILSVRDSNTVWAHCCAVAALQRPNLCAMFFEALRMEVLDTFARVVSSPDAYVCVAYVAAQFAAITLKKNSNVVPPSVRGMLSCMVPHQSVLRSLPLPHTPRSAIMARVIIRMLTTGGDSNVQPPMTTSAEQIDFAEGSAAMSTSTVNDAAPDVPTPNSKSMQWIRQFAKYQSAASVLRDIVEGAAQGSSARHSAIDQQDGSVQRTPGPGVGRSLYHALLTKVVKIQNPYSALRDLNPNVVVAPGNAPNNVLTTPVGCPNAAPKGALLFQALRKACLMQCVDSALKDTEIPSSDAATKPQQHAVS
jgi:hypothetical protein